MNSNIRNQVNLQGQLIMMGPKGYSAYELAVQEGFDGTVDDWLESLKGADGKNGIDGEPGLSSTIQVGTVNTLPAGSNATITNSGDETNAVFNFGIPKGDKGDKGDTGEIPEGTIESDDVDSIEVVETLPEVEQTNVLYLVKESVYLDSSTEIEATNE